MDSPQSQDVLIDANLLVLLVLGQFDASLVGRKPLDEYSVADFKLLMTFVKPFRRIRTTPHVLAEVNNLMDKSVSGRRRRELRVWFARFVELLDERWVKAEEICATEDFRRLGLADAGICRLVVDQITVISVDLPLCNELWGHGARTINFNHLRDALSQE